MMCISYLLRYILQELIVDYESDVIYDDVYTSHIKKNYI
jgi:hypothetical protein